VAFPFVSIQRASRRWVVGCFFALLALAGVALHRDYGMGWDEPADRLNAFVSAKYLALRLAPALARRQPRLADIPDLHQHRDADHGVLFMLPLVALEALMPGVDPAEWAYWRHLLGFFVFGAGVWATYRLGAARLGSWRWGLVGAALLVLSPRIFAEAFYNYKDLVFLALFALAMLTLTRWLRRPTLGRTLLHALATAAAIDVRTMGIAIVALTLGFGGLELLSRPLRRKAFLATLALYLPVLAAAVVLGWPYLWEQPLTNFLAALRSFGQYQKALEVFYLGCFVPVQQLPWHYAPLWLAITTPLPYLLLFALGLVTVLRPWLATPLDWLRRARGRHDLLLLAWLGGPLLGVMVLHSHIYDGWRHLYFIYPAFILIALQGTQALWNWWQRQPRRSGRWRLGAAVAAALALGTAQVGWRLVAEHPFQYAYFSFLPGPVIERNFERDYWGVSVREGLAWVLAHDARPRVPVSMDERTAMTLQISAKMLPPAQRARLAITSAAPGGYFLSIHRWHTGPYPASAGRPVHTIRVGGAVILTVLRRP
jgi:hypothetical protein